MVKIKDEFEDVNKASFEMLQNIQKDFPIDMVKVKAKSEVGNVLIYPLKDIELYRKTFISKYEKSIEDTFIFDKMATMYRKDENGVKHKTGWFCPLNFWDNIFTIINKQKYNSQ